MKVQLDVTSLMTETPTGIGVYIKNLILNLQHFPELEIAGSWYIEKFKSKSLISSHIPIQLRPYLHYLSGLNFSGFDIFHGPDFRIPRSRRMKAVVTIHDLVDYEDSIVDRKRSIERTRKFEQRLLNDKPDHIICISSFTREQLLLRFPQYESRTTVVHLAIDHLANDISLLKIRRLFEYPYLLFVGTVERRKNVITILKAFEIIKKELKDIHFIIVGKNGYFSQEIDDYIRQSQYRPAIHRLGFVSEHDLISLYLHSELFMLPSLYEGFGMPILEAMRLGCPVLTSNIGAMKEISNGAAIQVNPKDPEEMAHQVFNLYSNPERRKKLIDAGRTHSEQFTWKKCAAQTFDVYRKTLLQ